MPYTTIVFFPKKDKILLCCIIFPIYRTIIVPVNEKYTKRGVYLKLKCGKCV